MVGKLPSWDLTYPTPRYPKAVWKDELNLSQ